MKTLQVKTPSRQYPIVIGTHLLENSVQVLATHLGKKAALITNETLAPLYLTKLQHVLDSLNIDDLSQYSFVATAGTPTTIAAIKLGQDFFSYDRDIVNGTIVNLEDIENSLNKIRQYNPNDNHRNFGDIKFVSFATFEDNGRRNMK